MSVLFLRQRSKSLPNLLCKISFIRPMGGGPRTFPGGLNKWQYKRMHEKLARDKEHRLLQQEKQIYQARLRSEIRAKLAGKSASNDFPGAGGAGMSSKDHIRALADRFMKDGAEDLWNEDDGPIRPRSQAPPPPLDLRKIVTEKRAAAVGSFKNRRNYSKLSRNSSSDEDEDEDVVSFEGDRRKMISSAALRNYDVKMNRRRPIRADIEQSDLSRDIREFHQEVRSRASARSDSDRRMVEEGSILTQKR